MKSFFAGDRGGIPSGVFQYKLPIFNALGGGFCRKAFALRNLEAKFLKTGNLRGMVREAERRFPLPRTELALGLCIACFTFGSLFNIVRLWKVIMCKVSSGFLTLRVYPK
jgi:hypothetical protein